MVSEKAMLAVVVLAVVGFGAFMAYDVANRPDYSGMDIDETIPQGTGTGGQATGSEQVVKVRALATGLYDNENPVVKAGVPVRFEFSADPRSGCGRQVIVDGVGTNVNLISRNGETVVATFTPPRPGNYAFHCGMNMFRGVLTAT